MAKLDRLGWADSLCFISHGIRIGIRTNEPRVLESIPEYLPPGWKPAASPVVDVLYSLRVAGESGRRGVRNYNLLYHYEAQIARTMVVEEAFATLEDSLQLWVAERARRRVFVHAGVVAWRGQAILIPGHCMSGKTTLVAALMRAGATYYSDEYAVLDARGRVHPYPKPLGIRSGPEGAMKKHSAESLGGKTGVRPLPVGLVVATEYRAGACWRPRPLSPGRTVHALLAHTAPAQWQPAVALAALQQVALSAPALKGVRGEADETVDRLLESLDRHRLQHGIPLAGTHGDNKAAGASV